MLRDVADHPLHLHAPLISRLKIMAAMDIAERRKPQDGRIGLKMEGRDIDVRCSILPASHGETIVMRLLDRSRSLISLRELGFEDEDYKWFRRAIKRPNGIVLVTGPTGSGKTTTLYAALSELNRPDVKIITAEDPVEYHISGTQSGPGQSKIGLSFARILKAMLRAAPNIILVGEIRDLETAEIAIQAALTGHLVFSTLHTNDAASALTRLMDIGVKPFLGVGVGAGGDRPAARAAPVQGVRAGVRARRGRARSARDPARSAAGRKFKRPKGCRTCEGQRLSRRDRAVRAARDGPGDPRAHVQGREPRRDPRDGRRVGQHAHAARRRRAQGAARRHEHDRGDARRAAGFEPGPVKHAE
jgi:type IV pilus assembly protein PilB